MVMNAAQACATTLGSSSAEKVAALQKVAALVHSRVMSCHQSFNSTDYLYNARVRWRFSSKHTRI
jgi:hypothetical protein